jgi:hypothetical protein
MFTKKFLNSLSAIVIILGSHVFGQTTPSVTQNAKKSSCSNIVALAGDVKIDCSTLTPAQQKIIENIPALLHKILANQLDPDAVMSKLEEILHVVNPNLPKRTYACNGSWVSQSPDVNGLTYSFSPQGYVDPSVSEMGELTIAHQYQELLKVCTAQIVSKPEWLTPRLFCAFAYEGMGNITKAKEMLAAYDIQKGPAYDGADGCRNFSNSLHASLK